MKRYLRLIFFILIFIPSYCFSQDPSCEFIITLENVKNKHYDYKIIIQYDYEKENFDSVKKKLESNWEFSFRTIESSLLKSNSNHKIIVGYLSDYCYPNSDIDNQLRIIIARKEKEHNNVELMYTLCKLVPSRTEIFIKKFQRGLRENEVFEYEEDYINNKNIDYGHQQYLNLNSRKIYLK